MAHTEPDQAFRILNLPPCRPEFLNLPVKLQTNPETASSYMHKHAHQGSVHEHSSIMCWEMHADVAFLQRTEAPSCSKGLKLCQLYE